MWSDSSSEFYMVPAEKYQSYQSGDAFSSAGVCCQTVCIFQVHSSQICIPLVLLCPYMSLSVHHI